MEKSVTGVSEGALVFSQKSRRLVGVALAASLVYLALVLYSGWPPLINAARNYSILILMGILLLVMVGLLIRFIRWQFYLSRLGDFIPLSQSLQIFMGSFSLTATPGKAGELVKGVFLKQWHSIPFTRTAGILLAERVTDLLAMLILASFVLVHHQSEYRLYWACLLLVASIMLFVSLPRVHRMVFRMARRFPLSSIHRACEKGERLLEDARPLFSPPVLLKSSALSLVAWFCECLAFSVLLKGFHLTIPLWQATFIYAVSTIVGALSFLPGGVGGMEVSLLFFLNLHGVDKALAVPAVLLIRFSTLWFVTGVGLLFAWKLLARPSRPQTFLPVEKGV